MSLNPLLYNIEIDEKIKVEIDLKNLINRISYNKRGST